MRIFRINLIQESFEAGKLAGDKESLKEVICDDYYNHQNSNNYNYEMEKEICKFYLGSIDDVKTQRDFEEVMYGFFRGKYANHLSYFKSLFSQNGGMISYAFLPLMIKYKINIMTTDSLMDVELLVLEIFKEIAKQDSCKGIEYLTMFNTFKLLNDLIIREAKTDKDKVIRTFASNIRLYMATKKVICWEELVKIIRILDIASDILIKYEVDFVWNLFDGISFDKSKDCLEKVEQKLIRVKPEM